MENTALSLADCLRIIQHRKYYILIPWGIFSLLAVVVALHQPRTYRSTATILIEAPKMLTALAQSTMVDTADEQIDSLKQRVLTTHNILTLIASENLYGDLRDRLAPDEQATLFREHTEVQLASSVRATSNTALSDMIFTISFSDGEPERARNVATALTDLFISQNVQARTRRAGKATGFLTAETERLNADIRDLDRQITQYKERYGSALPEFMATNLSIMDRTESELRDTENKILALEEREAILAEGLARSEADGPAVAPDSQSPRTAVDEASALRAEYLRLSSRYYPSHPDVIRAKRQLDLVAPELADKPGAELLQRELRAARQTLASLEAKYTDPHPDLSKERNRIAQLEERLRAVRMSEPVELAGPVRRIRSSYGSLLETQYKSGRIELESLRKKKQELHKKLAELRQVVSQTPKVETGYANLLRDRDNKINRYNELKEKLLEARFNQTLEESQQGLAFTVIEQPMVPRNPEKGSRRKVAIIGFVLALGAGLGTAFLVEYLDPRLKGYQAVCGASGLMPLVVIPYIETPRDVEARLARRHRRNRGMLWAGGVGLLVGLIVLYIYFQPWARLPLKLAGIP
jgi:succinoglycan biosynthesis transport protein ExoP